MLANIIWIYVIGTILGMLVCEFNIRAPVEELTKTEKQVKLPKKKGYEKPVKLNLKACMICHEVSDGVECMGNHICHKCIEENSE